MRFSFGSCAVLLTLLSANAASAAPRFRQSVTQRGDLVLIGNTLAHSCANETADPVVGTIGDCGTDTDESAPDIYFNGSSASIAVTPAQASTTAALRQGTAKGVQIPAGATVTYARLYWAATLQGSQQTPNATAAFSRAGTFAETITADTVDTLSFNATLGGTDTWYQASADVTNLVRTHGVGTYTVGNIATRILANRRIHEAFAGWSLVVFYAHDTSPVRSLALYDGLDVVDGNQVDINFTGFVVPGAGFEAAMGVVAYEGDQRFGQDRLQFGPTAAGLANVTNALNPADNFFNGTRSVMGQAISVVGDLPQTSGEPSSLSGVDLDIVDVTNRMTPNQTRALMRVRTDADSIALGVSMFSISSISPDFSRSPKTVKNITRPNAAKAQPGDVVEYEISITNNGNDVARDAVLTDEIPAGLTYEPGTITVKTGPNPGAKTDAAGDDVAEYDAASRTVRVRLGTGANASQGGRIAIDGETSVTFRAKVNDNPPAVITNVGAVEARGETGANQGVQESETWDTVGPDGTTGEGTQLETEEGNGSSSSGGASSSGGSSSGGASSSGGRGNDAGDGDDAGAGDEGDDYSVEGGAFSCATGGGNGAGAGALTLALLGLAVTGRVRRGKRGVR